MEMINLTIKDCKKQLTFNNYDFVVNELIIFGKKLRKILNY